MYANHEQPGSSRSVMVQHGLTRQPIVHRPLTRFFRTLVAWEQRWRQRRVLETLDSRAIKDLGLSDADVYREASKPFWVR